MIGWRRTARATCGCQSGRPATLPRSGRLCYSSSLSAMLFCFGLGTTERWSPMGSPRLVHDGPLSLDPGTFGRTEACRILVEKLNTSGDPKLASAVTWRPDEGLRGARDRSSLLTLPADLCPHRRSRLLELHQGHELAAIPAKNRPDAAAPVVRTEVGVMETIPFNLVGNRTEVIMNGAVPVMRDGVSE